jgi:hypothetical protein
MRDAGARFGCTSAGGEVAVPDGAQHLPEALLVWLIVLEGDRPGIVLDLASSCHLRSQTRDELSDLRSVVESEMCGGGSVTIVVVPHDDSDSIVFNGVERILVGEVIAQVNRQQWR